tara:strand:+ start:372 stop:992 length:621 start_codon:yes stop_codon:yes gene_type:complete
MKTWLLFTTGDGTSDPLNWDSSDAGLYSREDLKTIKPSGPNSLDMVFDILGRIQTVTLKIKNGSHIQVISSIINSIEKSDQATIAIADVGSGNFVNPSIYDVEIKTGTPVLYYNKIVNATAVKIIDINTKLTNLTSMTIANVHSAAATVQVYLLDAAGILYYIIKDVVIPVGSTLKLESDELDYNGDIFNLYVKLGGSTPVDVIVR